MKLLSVLLSVVAGATVGVFMLLLTALLTITLFGEAKSLMMSIVHVTINFGVAILAAVVAYCDIHRYLSRRFPVQRHT